jgi:NADPH-dependent glutamate synthase beta subunit-like oxidoreductase/NAD(P)H-flavin reductase
VETKALYELENLAKIDEEFLGYLADKDDLLAKNLRAVRQQVQQEEIKNESMLLLQLAPYCEEFIAKLFNIKQELDEASVLHQEFVDFYNCKRNFVQRYALKKYQNKTVNKADIDGFDKLKAVLGEKFSEAQYVNKVTEWLKNKDEHSEMLEIAAQYAAWAHQHKENSILFSMPAKLDFDNLVHTHEKICGKISIKEAPSLVSREGFGLTDEGGSLEEALNEAHYCIYCHDRDKDSCSKGLKDKKGSFKFSPTKVALAGCPLEQKISEMNLLKAQGNIIGALAVVMIDNPMCAGTGHRICNDCMKSCIYQKQEPVDIPKVETRILRDVLSLPFGFEIYSLLSRWNPLNFKNPLPKTPTNKKILVVGLGPAGYTLAHYLLNEGHTVIAIDGLKIEPLPEYISGVAADGRRAEFCLIKDARKELFEPLEKRQIGGFGGVAEYGITARWDKNYLKLIRILLERRQNFAMFGGVRFGSTINAAQSFDLGFDHIALAMGSGSPKIINIPGMLSKGVRMASDFLMSLQLTGAAKEDSVANLQIRMPIIVIGGGLTAIDTATEAAAYYPIQVAKFSRRYNILVQKQGKEKIEAEWDDEEREIAAEFLQHAEEIKQEKMLAIMQKRKPNLAKLLKKWGGVRVVYRKRLQDSPGYRLNHEEVKNALAEGIEFVENAAPLAVLVDKYKYAKQLKMKVNEQELALAAKTILIAAGTDPNVILAKEDERIKLEGKYFRAIDGAAAEANHDAVSISLCSKQKNQLHSILAAKLEDGRAISFFGDLHPFYRGSVVKAMASAKQGYGIISSLIEKRRPSSKLNSKDFINKLSDLLHAKIVDVIVHATKIVEVIIKAPLAARNFQPGQFYRLQNFEYFASKLSAKPDIIPVMEGLALTGYWVDKQKGLISTIALEIGVSSSICRYLKPGDPVIFMGPTGSPSFIPKGENVMLVGGGVGNAVLPSIGKAMIQNTCQVIYFSGYKKAEERFGTQLIEEAAQQVIWACDEAMLGINREQDLAFHGNIINAIMQYQQNKLGKKQLDLKEIDRIFVIGSAQMMEAVTHAYRAVLKPHLKPGYKIVASINSPMQCMMKEICAQCLQRHQDPVTGKVSFVYSCFKQDQDANWVDFSCLKDRLKQNSLQERLVNKLILI